MMPGNQEGIHFDEGVRLRAYPKDRGPGMGAWQSGGMGAASAEF